MQLAFMIKVMLWVLGSIGTLLSGLFFYFLNSLKSSNDLLKRQISKLNDKIDLLKLKYFLDIAGFGKIFAFKQLILKVLSQLTKRIERLLDKQDKN